MLFKLSDEDISELKGKYANAHQALQALVTEYCPEKLENLRYPSIKYEPCLVESWKEFERCFHKDREKVYQEMLRPKYKNNNPAFRITGGK